MAGRKNLRCVLLIVVICLIAGIEGGRGRISMKRTSRVGGKGGGSKSGGGPSNSKDTTSEPDHGSPQDDESTDDELEDALGMDMKCQGVDMKLTEKQILHIKECASSAGIKDRKDVTTEKFPCFAKCIFEHKKLVDENGMPHKENIKNMFTEILPDVAKQALAEGLERCLEEHASTVKPADETCMTYAPLGICVHETYMEVCK